MSEFKRMKVSSVYNFWRYLCIEKDTIKGVLKIVNIGTILQTLENKTVFGQENGMIYTEDGQSISWKSLANLLKGK